MQINQKKMYLLRLVVYIFIVSYSIFGIINDESTICLFRHFTGYECYTCGLTRAFISCFHFDFAKGIAYNPLVAIILPLFLFVMIQDTLVFIKNIFYKINEKSFIASII